MLPSRGSELEEKVITFWSYTALADRARQNRTHASLLLERIVPLNDDSCGTGPGLDNGTLGGSFRDASLRGSSASLSFWSERTLACPRRAILVLESPGSRD